MTAPMPPNAPGNSSDPSDPSELNPAPLPPEPAAETPATPPPPVVSASPAIAPAPAAPQPFAMAPLPDVIPLSTAEKLPKKPIHARQIVVATFLLALGLFVIAYRMLQAGHLQQTAAMFIGLPTLLSVAVVLMPRTSSATLMIVKAITVAVLVLAMFLEEGMICVMFIVPVFYLVGVFIGAIIDLITRKERKVHRRVLCLAVLPLLIMSLEGTTESLSFNRAETVTVSRDIAATSAEIEAALSRAPRFDHPLPFFLTLDFPRPLESWGEGLAVGAERGIHFGAGEGPPGDVVAVVTAHEPGFVRFEIRSNTTDTVNWLDLQAAECRYTPSADAPGKTKVEWRLFYSRKLDPAWYFAPLERHGIQCTGEYLLDVAATPADPATTSITPAAPVAAAASATTTAR